MSIKELKEWKELKKKQNVEKWNQMKDENGSCNGLTDKEYNSIKVSKMKNRTRRVHSKGNLWKHNDKQRIKRTIKHWWE